MCVFIKHLLTYIRKGRLSHISMVCGWLKPDILMWIAVIIKFRIVISGSVYLLLVFSYTYV